MLILKIKLSAYHVKLVVLNVLLKISVLNVMRNIFSSIMTALRNALQKNWLITALISAIAAPLDAQAVFQIQSVEGAQKAII